MFVEAHFAFRPIMADDTRQQETKEDLSKEALTVDPNRRAFAGDQWKDAKKDYQSTPANILAGGKENTAGGKLQEVSISNAFDGSLKLSDFTELPKRPCVRESLLNGLYSGFAVGGVRILFRGTDTIDSVTAQRFCFADW